MFEIIGLAVIAGLGVRKCAEKGLVNIDKSIETPVGKVRLVATKKIPLNIFIQRG